ncbi:MULTISPECIES: SLC13 family permease [Stutzerimonas stutzeri subgroup]|jgi:di/tricarboxylate transporter|uniref:Sodium/sulfate symporter family protein n=1 Tax=Stutzerimonas stutzeri NF13 TaxID=1212548 RepID=M2VK36_STUST|nr:MULTISPECIES: SLC13 family permease [Stutzerimonas stutzeri subgroup]EME00019.1 sodium/sulfate symporter family protein [Stutzerimonas stutzeri NF13]MBK3881559.1 SLC13 family permease [Stutzerimonas stutzeri]MCQ4289996.1 SLC13 family permease [Stutzerimonas stutzeri]WOF78405.1 SLC13 family permease [Pseudomonas sp. FeN3W]
MTGEQLIVFGVLAATLVLFVWNRWRYDLVALGALLACALTGVVPADEVFSGIGHPAVISVAAVLVLSRGLLNAGVVDSVARRLMQVGERPWAQVAALTGIVALSSGFMNNVGALALFMPVAIWMSRQSGRSPSYLLMPLAFGSLLGGTLTLIGTPPNLIIAGYRAEAGEAPFGMFAFLPVGAAVTVAGVLFIALLGWRLVPQRQEQEGNGDLFEISAYLTEVRVPESCKYAGRTLHALINEVKDEADVQVIALVRGDERQRMPSTYEVLREGDILLVEADSDSLKALLDVTGVELAANVDEQEEKAQKAQEDTAQAVEDEKTEKNHKSRHGELTLAEAIISPGSILVGTTASGLDLRERHGVNVLAVARQGQRLRQRLGKIRFATGDILLLQARENALQSSMNSLGCLPLASRGLSITTPRNVLLASAIFAITLATIAFGLVPAATALVSGALVMILVGLVPVGRIYDSIDMSVIVLVAAMLPVGEALETSGGSQLIAEALLELGPSLPAAATLALLMVAVMLISNVVNNAAAAVLAAPVAISLARGMDVSVDPFLMAVAIGASCAFLTPIGHQSNTLVMAPGGYRFGDYWRLGLPLSILVVLCSVPAILWIWPL